MAYLCADRISAAAGMTISASASRSSGLAPLYVFFDATATTDSSTTEPFHELYYKWDFDDPTSGTFDYGSRADISRNVAYGPVAAHVYETAGTYNPTLTVFNGVATKVYTFSNIVVSAWPADANTIAYASGAAPVAGVDGVPASATCVGSATWPMIVAAAATNKRLLLKHDDTFTGASGTALTVTGPCMIGMYGTGAKPLIRTTSTANQSALFLLTDTVSDLRMVDLEFDGQSDTHRFAFNSTSATLTNFLMLRCDAQDLGGGAVIGRGPSAWPVNVGVVDCTFQRFNGGGAATPGQALFMETVNSAVLGCLLDDTDAGAAEQLVRHNYLSYGVNQCNTYRNVIADKEMLGLRGIDSSATVFGQTGAALATRYFVASDNRIEANSGFPIHLTANNSSVFALIHDVIIERNLVLFETSATTAQYAFKGFGDLITIRNNITDLTDADNTTAHIGYEIDQAVVNLPAMTNLAHYNNSIYNGDTSGFQGVAIKTDTTGVIYNNLAYAPSASSQAVIDGTAAGVTSGNNSSNGQADTTCPYADTTPRDPSLGEYDPIVYALTGALATVPVFDDFNAEQRNFGNKAPVMQMGAVKA